MLPPPALKRITSWPVAASVTWARNVLVEGAADARRGTAIDVCINSSESHTAGFIDRFYVQVRTGVSLYV